MALINSRRTRPGVPSSVNFNILAEMVRRLATELQASDADSQNNDVILDAEVDGARYQLVRSPKDPETPVRLSPREYEIVRLVASGHPNKIIADILQISSFTVSTYLRRVFAKLGVCSRAAVVAQFHELGLSKAHEQDATSIRSMDDAAVSNPYAFRVTDGSDASMRNAMRPRSPREPKNRHRISS